ncbi:hypothetical protein WJX73_008615 [Symbiochloris irregularis]|uniref:Pyrroloquinoline quinone-dependent pyranose dehydrogenase beta-propeller domain-containing protein n=1 Tax=Symbiochloris irregularis TaxID=706552 RepID=A0AAW1P2L2_9CHLO
MKGLFVFLLVLVIESVSAQSNAPSALPLDLIQLPDGFSISLYTTTAVPSARQLALSRGRNAVYRNIQVVYVGSTGSEVVALVDAEGIGSNITAVTVLTNQTQPNGVVWHEGSLYVAETRRITRYDNPDVYAISGQAFPSGTVIAEDWNPIQDDHQYHFIGVGPDGYLYVPQGAPSNTGPCNAYQNITQCAINRMDLDGSNQLTLATGIRNSVGFDWDDGGNLWATTNGRDNLDGLGPIHDNRPDDTLFYIPNGTQPDTLDFGFPYCHWVGEGDPELRSVGSGTSIVDDVNFPPGIPNTTDAQSQYCFNVTDDHPPSQALGPHVAALGVAFYQGDMFPMQYNGSLFIAQHGSWDRVPKIGYRVMNAAVMANGSTTSYEYFASGWLQNASDTSSNAYWGRPVDVLPLPDGSILVSDDYANTVYRITYEAPVVNATPIPFTTVTNTSNAYYFVG